MAGGVGTFKHDLAVKLHSIRRAVQQLCAQLADLFPQLHSALFSGLTGDIGGAGGVGAGIVGGGIRIRTKDGNVIQRAVQHLGGDLCQRGVAAGAHIGSADHQGIEAVIVQLESCAAHVHAGDTGALHGHTHAHGTDLAVAHIPGGILVLPVDHLAHLKHTPVQRTAGIYRAVVGGHHIALLYGVLQAQCNGVHVQLVCQLIDGRFHRKQTLCSTIAAVCTGRHVVGIYHITDKAKGFGLAVQRDGLMTGQAHGSGAVLAVSASVRQRVEVNALHDAVLGSAQTDVHLHLVARRRSRLTFHAAEDELGRLFGHPSHKGRVNLADSGLLCAKTAADAGLGDTHHGLGNVQRIGDVAAGMEHDLGRAEHIQPSISINGTIGAEGLHHGLLTGLSVVHMVNDHIAPGQHSVDITVAAFIMSAEVALVVGAHGGKALPVILRVHKDRIILCGVEIQHGFQHLIIHFNELECLVHALFILTGYDGYHISHKADVAIDEQTVVGTGLRVSLAGLRITAGILRHILPSEDGFDAGHLFGNGGVDGADDGVCMGRAQQLDDQAVLRDEIIHINRLAGDQLHRVFFAERFVDGFHCAPSFCFFHARKFIMPRSWPS